jgi:hypothetical protein
MVRVAIVKGGQGDRGRGKSRRMRVGQRVSANFVKNSKVWLFGLCYVPSGSDHEARSRSHIENYK